MICGFVGIHKLNWTLNWTLNDLKSNVTLVDLCENSSQWTQCDFTGTLFFEKITIEFNHNTM